MRPSAVASAERLIPTLVDGAVPIKAYRAVEGLHLVRVQPGDANNALRRLRADANVLYAEPDYILTVEAVPNDPLFPFQWGLRNAGQTVNADPGQAGADVRAIEAWDFWTGDPNFRVAVIDTGINYAHPDLIANIWTNPDEVAGNNLDDDGNGYVDDVHGFNTLLGTGQVFDDNGHGSHVAGVIGATANNGIGLSGLNWRCKLVALKFADSQGQGPTSAAIDALEYVIANQIRISNNSWGCYECFSQALEDAIVATQAVDHLFVTSAGNGIFGLGVDVDIYLHHPASYELPNIIAVAASDNNDQKSKFSNYGTTTVDVAAPGGTVLSTYLGVSYQYLDGTSMAAPHVTGVAALLKSRLPQLTAEQLRERIIVTARPVDAFRDITVSHGIVDARAAVADCNRNGILDELDVSNGGSVDCDQNGIPDDCQPDCNHNQIVDACDIGLRLSADCDANGVPDECQPDCDNNHVADPCDVLLGYSYDCNGNLVPDDCEPGGLEDCNGNALADLCDIADGVSGDCNGNAIPDECDIASGLSADCSFNRIPDECERDCNENQRADSCDLLAGTSLDLDHDGVPDECALGISLVPVAADRNAVIRNRDITIVQGGATVTFEVQVVGWDLDFDGSPKLRFYQAGIDPASLATGIGGELALARLRCINSDDCLGDAVCMPDGYCEESGSLGVDEQHPKFVFAPHQTITLTDVENLRFGSGLFDPNHSVADRGYPRYLGTVILSVPPKATGVFTVAFEPSETLLGDPTDESTTIPIPALLPARIIIAPDCNGNGRADELDIALGASPDCDRNGEPDECLLPENDCNHNGTPDVCDAESGTSPDCNGNGIPDECLSRELDCNHNQIPDACDIDAGRSLDCNGNRIPDDCITLETDCDHNGIPDGCDIASGYSQDCNDNGKPDICERDCNQNGLADECDIATSHSADVDGNGYPDECQRLFRVPADYLKIQDAIDAAGNGDVVLLAPGIYSGVGNRELDFRGRDVVVRGDGAPQACILDAEGAQSGVLFTRHEGRSAILENVTVRNAFNVGVVCIGSSPTVRNCIVTENGGITGGMLVDTNSKPMIVDTVFSYNRAGFSGAGLVSHRSEITVLRCLFLGNVAGDKGGGLYVSSGTARIEDCFFGENGAKNAGGGAALGSGFITVTGCVFRKNSTTGAGFGDGGGLHLGRIDAVIASSLFDGNSARRNGGAIYIMDGDPTITNCTLVGNRATGKGGGVFRADPTPGRGGCCYFGHCISRVTPAECEELTGIWYPGISCNQIQCGTRACCLPNGGCDDTNIFHCAAQGGTVQDENTQCLTYDCSPTLRNSIVWQNRAGEGANLYADAPFLQVSDSTIEGGWAGTGNAALDPVFVNPGRWLGAENWLTGNSRLLPESPSVNQGVAGWLRADLTADLDGHTRILCGAVDRGAYELGIGDYDCNQIVDLLDYAPFAACSTGVDVASGDLACGAFDYDGDGDIDLSDYANFQNTVSPAAP